MKNIKKISNLDLSEMITLMSRINDEINSNFSHIQIKQSVKKANWDYLRELQKEYDRRE